MEGTEGACNSSYSYDFEGGDFYQCYWDASCLLGLDACEPGLIECHSELVADCTAITEESVCDESYYESRGLYYDCFWIGGELGCVYDYNSCELNDNSDFDEVAETLTGVEVLFAVVSELIIPIFVVIMILAAVSGVCAILLAILSRVEKKI